MRSITDLLELKTIELDIMRNIHEFCVERDIWYVLTYGTLLGAIRHNGFIPWDDDIDIHMTREGYERFEREFPEWGKERNLKIVNNHTKGNEFPRDMAKVCDTRTTLVEREFKSGCRLGVFVDIWPLDSVPEELTLKDRIRLKRIEFVKRCAQAAEVKRNSNTFQNFGIKKKMFVLLFGNGNSVKLSLLQEKLSKTGRVTQSIRDISFQANRRFYDAKDLFPPVLHRFEDAVFYIPNNYDRILKLTFGDYMKLPPVEQQKPHHIQDVWWN